MKFLLALFLPVFVFAQSNVPDDSRPVAETLRNYLKLTEAQSREIARNAVQFEASLMLVSDRVEEINRLILSETEKPSPGITVLGGYYRDIEDLCRQTNAPSRDVYARQLRLLDEPQRSLLRKLENMPPRLALANAARASFLLSGSIYLYPLVTELVPAFPLPSPQYLAPSIVAYLELTPAQIDAFVEGKDDLSTYANPRVAQVEAVGRQIREELASPSPQPFELGSRYLLLETLRRQVAARAEALRRGNLSLLTPFQRQRLRELEGLEELDYLARLASIYRLLPPLEKRSATEEPFILRGISTGFDIGGGEIYPRSLRCEAGGSNFGIGVF